MRESGGGMLGLNPGFRDLPLHTMLPGFGGLGGLGGHHHGGGGGPPAMAHPPPVSSVAPGGGLPNMWPFIWSHISKKERTEFVIANFFALSVFLPKGF